MNLRVEVVGLVEAWCQRDGITNEVRLVLHVLGDLDLKVAMENIIRFLFIKAPNMKSNLNNVTLK